MTCEWYSKMMLQYLLVAIYIGGAFMMPDYDDLEKHAVTLPPGVLVRLKEPINEKVKRKFKETLIQKCNNFNITPGYLEKTVRTFGDCSTLIIQLDIKKATPKEENDAIFCEKILPCLRGTANSMRQCFNPDERDTTNVLDTIFDSVQELMCHKNGEKPMLTGDEGACFRSKKYEILNCFKEFSSVDIKDVTSFISFFDWPILKSMRDGECGQLDGFKKCAVGVLNKCDTDTTSDLAEALFESIHIKTRNLNKSRNSRVMDQTNRAVYSKLHSSGSALNTGTPLATRVALLMFSFYNFIR